MPFLCSLRCETRDGTAKQPNDYDHNRSSVVFDFGEKTKNFTVKIKDDEVTENDEIVKVNCSTSNPRVNLLPSCNNVEIRIENDDCKYTVQ